MAHASFLEEADMNLFHETGTAVRTAQSLMLILAMQ